MYRILTIALLLVPSLVQAQELDQVQQEWVERGVNGFRYHVRKCSLQANETNQKGPVTVELTFGPKATIESVKVVDPRLAKTDVGRCIANGEHSRSYGGVKLAKDVVRTKTYKFHGWAGKSKRKWSDVEAKLRKLGTVKALQTCASFNAKGERRLAFHFFIKPDGSVSPVFKPSGKSPGPPGADGERTINECFADVLEGLKFKTSGNKYVVGFKWGRDRSKMREFSGNVVEPLKCEIEGYPCSFAEADPERTKLSFEYIQEFGKRVDCKNPKPAIEWLKKQPHVRSVVNNGCSVHLFVEGARPAVFMEPHKH